MSKSQQGLTLIEVMIVVVVLAILSSIAVPSYQSYVARSYRAEAKSQLSRAANLQEQYYMDFQSYTQNMKALGMGSNADAYTTESGRYEVSMNVSGSTYTVLAKANDKQSNLDPDCKELTLDSTGFKGPIGSEECW